MDPVNTNTPTVMLQHTIFPTHTLLQLLMVTDPWYLRTTHFLQHPGEISQPAQAHVSLLALQTASQQTTACRYVKYSQCSADRGLEEGCGGGGEDWENWDEAVIGFGAGTGFGAVCGRLGVAESASVWGTELLRTLLTRSVRRDTARFGNKANV